VTNGLGSVQDRPPTLPTPPEQSGSRSPTTLVRWSIGIVAAVSGAVLLLAAFAGRLVRPIAEDWCTMDQIRDFGGIPGLVGSFYEDANGRVANAVANGVVFLHGAAGPKVFPALLTLAFVVGTFLLISLGATVLGWRVSWMSSLAVATTVAAALFFGGQVVYQVFFWASGSISHTLPSAIGVWTVVVVLVAERVDLPWSRITAVVVCALAGVFEGSLSEAFFAVSGLYAAVAAVLGVVVFRRSGNRYPLAYAASYLAGLIVGFLTLYFSPGRAARQTTPIDQAPLLSPTGVGDLLGSWFHTWAAIAHGPAYLAPLAIGVLVGLGTSPGRRPSWRPVLGAIPLALALLASLAVDAELRIGYGPNGWTYERTWTNFLYPVLLTLCFYGVLLGRFLASTVIRRREMVAVVATAGIVAIVGLVSVLPGLTSMTHDLGTRAKAWDAQDVRIRHEVLLGKDRATYVPYRIGGLSEPFSYRSYEQDWVRRCVMQWYSVDDFMQDKRWLRKADPAYRY
jgi:hypothetical protein